MSLTAAQLVYTNVEKKLSPRGRDGFQIWLRTPDFLTEPEETEIQTRLGDFEERRDLKDEPSVRHSYFTLPSGRAVVARTVPLAATDEFKRGGRYYAHAVILDALDFRRLDNDPFAVFDQVAFQSSLADGQAAGNLAAGALPMLALAERPAERAASLIGPEKLPPLLHSLLRACEPGKPLMIGVAAPPRRVLALARQLIGWLPPALRPVLSFDTLSSGRSLTQIPYALVGLPTTLPKRYLNLAAYDMARQAFPQPVAASDSTYARWLGDHLKAGRPPDLPRSEAAYQLAACLDSGRVEADRLAGVDEALFVAIACSDHGVPKLDAILRGRLTADVGDALAPLLHSHAVHWLRSGGLAAFRRLGEPFPPGVLLRWLLAVYEARTRADIQRKIEIPALKDFYDRAKNLEADDVPLRKRLALVLFRWAPSWGLLARWVTDTELVPDDVYARFADWALKTLPVRVELSAAPTARGVWCGLLVSCEAELDDRECQALVAALTGQAEGEPPARLPGERWAWLMQHLMAMAG